MYAIILENETGKIVYLLTKFKYHNFTVCRNVESAKYVFERPLATPIDLFLDFELDPGCGDGIEYLKWAVQYSQLIKKVYITSSSREASIEMAKICKDNNVAYEYARPVSGE